MLPLNYCVLRRTLNKLLLLQCPSIGDGATTLAPSSMCKYCHTGEVLAAAWPRLLAAHTAPIVRVLHTVYSRRPTLCYSHSIQLIDSTG